MKRADGKNRRCVIDVTLAVNGIPVVTAELKNPLTGQRAARAMRQYADERDGRDLLFAFKQRALVHFAVDTGRGVDDDSIEGQGDWLPALQPRQRPRGGQPAGRGELEDRIIFGKKCWRPTACWKSCNASCTSK